MRLTRIITNKMCNRRNVSFKNFYNNYIDKIVIISLDYFIIIVTSFLTGECHEFTTTLIIAGRIQTYFDIVLPIGNQWTRNKRLTVHPSESSRLSVGASAEQALCG
ncbi:uncharacterized protein LOC112553005 [Pogonomyrmex barbatus]|uniref:Uncharacterized protein LOC112553005 n=1 Tax=Pogonomyrmex barbatus TaxID=144034 RepID=A0A8N1SBJ0_9HYME|nr:uncharacterized protein LOC112553005 [Pogonomyrmex barbatus]